MKIEIKSHCLLIPENMKIERRDEHSIGIAPKQGENTGFKPFSTDKNSILCSFPRYGYGAGYFGAH